MKTKKNFAIVGATGAVGTTLLNLIEERKFKFNNLYLIASSRSSGKKISFMGAEYTIHDLEKFDFSKVDCAFFSAGTEISNIWAKKIALQGVLIIDNTNAFRMDKYSPLVVPQVNGEVLKVRPRSNIISNPNCSTIPVSRTVKDINKELKLKKMIISTYQAASGAGLIGINDLNKSIQDISSNTKNVPHRGRFQVPLGYNLIPSIDIMLDSGFTLEEQKLLQESRKILNHPKLEVSATAVRVPVENCHSESVYFETEAEIKSIEFLKGLISSQEEVILYDEKGEKPYPTPLYVSGSNYVHVGRVRIDQLNKNAGWFWVVSDNLKIGAALNAIQIAEKVVEFGLL